MNETSNYGQFNENHMKTNEKKLVGYPRESDHRICVPSPTDQATFVGNMLLMVFSTCIQFVTSLIIILIILPEL